MEDVVPEIETVARSERASRVTLVRVRLGALSHFTTEHFRAHFAEAERINEGKLLIGKVLLARHCGVNGADRELFHSTLIGVLSTDPAIWPEQRLANEFALHKARRYLKYEKDYFR